MILVTGGTGLVGSHLLYDLTNSGQKVRAIKRKNSDTEQVKKAFSYYTDNVDFLFNQIEWVDADLLNIYSLLDAMEGITQIYHAAAAVSFSEKDKELIEKINVEGTANMVNAALTKGVNRFCQVSSISALGKNENGELTTESTFWKYNDQLSLYSISKYNADREVWRASEEGLTVIIVYPALIIGPGNWKRSSSAMFGMAHKGLRFYTHGINGFVDIRDVAQLSIMLMNSNFKNEGFILSSENVGFKYVFDVMHEALGTKKPAIKAGKFLSEFAWRAEKIRCFFSGSRPLITKETAQTAHKNSRFSNEKVLKTFSDYKFISIEQSVKDTAKLFLRDLKK